MEQRTISGNFEITLNLTDRRGVKMTGYVYSDDTPDDIHARVDLYQAVLDRQSIRVDVINKEAQIEMFLLNHENTKREYEQMAAKKARGSPLKTTEKQAMETHARNMEHTIEQVASIRSAIAEGKRKLLLNGSAVPSA